VRPSLLSAGLILLAVLGDAAVPGPRVSRAQPATPRVGVLQSGGRVETERLFDQVAYMNRAQIVTFARRHRLPSLYGTTDFADAGELMAYGPNVTEQWRRASVFVDKILEGARPADLPVEQPREIEMVLNLKIAKALGRRADRVVEWA
jgi:hypothetical protein